MVVLTEKETKLETKPIKFELKPAVFRSEKLWHASDLTMIVENVFKADKGNSDYPWNRVASFVYLDRTPEKHLYEAVASVRVREGWARGDGIELTRKIGDADYKIKYSINSINEIVMPHQY